MRKMIGCYLSAAILWCAGCVPPLYSVDGQQLYDDYIYCLDQLNHDDVVAIAKAVKKDFDEASVEKIVRTTIAFGLLDKIARRKFQSADKWTEFKLCAMNASQTSTS